MTATLVRLLVAAVLFGAWVYLVASGRADSASMLDFIKYTLVGLAAHIVTKDKPKP